MNADMAFAEFLDWCCHQFVKSPKFRRALRRELPKAGAAHG